MEEKHPFAPVWDEKSRVLILGSFPSVKSRETGFYYGHPRNRFWVVTAGVFNLPVPETVEEKLKLLHETHIALWDVAAACEVTGSADSSIRRVRANDLRPILDAAPICAVFVNGRTAERYYNRFQRAQIGMDAVFLPSTSPANAAWTADELIRAWRVIRR